MGSPNESIAINNSEYSKKGSFEIFMKIGVVFIFITFLMLFYLKISGFYKYGSFIYFLSVGAMASLMISLTTMFVYISLKLFKGKVKITAIAII